MTDPVKINGMIFCIVEENAAINGLLNSVLAFGTNESSSQLINLFIFLFS